MATQPGNATPAVLRPDGLPAPLGLYSHGSRVGAGGELLFIAGQLAVGSDGQSVGRDDFEAQARQAFANVRAVLAGAGMGPEHVAKFTTYLSAAEYIKPFYQAREKIFAEWYPARDFPPNTLLVVTRLVQPEFMVEIEAIAARGPGAG
jgi:2-iminobutanoate/2-iminopropanoate deaminase